MQDWYDGCRHTSLSLGCWTCKAAPWQQYAHRGNLLNTLGCTLDITLPPPQDQSVRLVKQHLDLRASFQFSDLTTLYTVVK